MFAKTCKKYFYINVFKQFNIAAIMNGGCARAKRIRVRNGMMVKMMMSVERGFVSFFYSSIFATYQNQGIFM